MEIDFGWLARLFLILLFVIIGVHLHLEGIWKVPLIAIAFIIMRCIAKFSGIWITSKKSHLTPRQSLAISLALFPMAGVAVGMSNTLLDYNPSLATELMMIIGAVIAVLDLIGPIATQYGLLQTKEGILKLNSQGKNYESS
jgi:Kef-type K+ transport system membrane component KefB